MNGRELREMIRRLPRRIKLGHWRVDIVLASQTVLREEMDDDDGGFYEGCWVPDLEADRGRIFILETLPLAKKWDVLWHEMYHALTDISSWDAETRPSR